MSTRARQAAGREWVYQLRQLSSDLKAQGQEARARELERLAKATEQEMSPRRVDSMGGAGGCGAGEDWGCPGHASVAEAFLCALTRMGEGGREVDRLRRTVRRAAEHVNQAVRGVASVPMVQEDDDDPFETQVLSDTGYEHLARALDVLADEWPAAETTRRSAGRGRS